MSAESATAAARRCWLVTRSPERAACGGVVPLSWDPAAPPPPGEAVVAVEAAGFNCKDALACAGHPGVMRIDALVPGIDLAGGGVGMLAVARLAAAGRRVVACTRKESCRDALAALGAAEVAAPADLVDPSPKSLARGRWTAVVDTVGGPLLADLLRSVAPGGAVAAIGMAGGDRLDTTVHPFILRGVTLAGIDAASLPTPAERRRLWDELAAFWPRLEGRLPLTMLALDGVGAWAERMLRGATTGRGVVRP